MILLKAPTHDIYLHQARFCDGQPEYVLLYGLEVTRHKNRQQAMQHFCQVLNHAEECETGQRFHLYANAE